MNMYDSFKENTQKNLYDYGKQQLQNKVMNNKSFIQIPDVDTNAKIFRFKTSDLLIYYFLLDVGSC